ncbi:hypothetical protein [Corynebacterium qintianiae]|uniref:hypothetical protein n=1 Tax=Corynebacterium qintianiae TaxID=2709392 RepID=UPI0013E9B6B9|nr:hypothetical protein [Corynebacterium qintianiae]
MTTLCTIIIIAQGAALGLTITALIHQTSRADELEIENLRLRWAHLKDVHPALRGRRDL